VILSVVLVFTLVGLAVQNRRVTSLEFRLLRLTRGADDGNLQDVLEAHLDSVGRVVDEVDELSTRAAVLEARSTRAFQRIGFVRFNPFDDTGGNQSFVLALLDGREDGFILSSLHTRTATRIYAKTVSGGRSEGALSDEESQALELARSNSGGRTIDGAVDVRIATSGSGVAAGPTEVQRPVPAAPPVAPPEVALPLDLGLVGGGPSIAPASPASRVGPAGSSGSSGSGSSGLAVEPPSFAPSVGGAEGR
jgi:hypothetical protein